MIKWWNPPGKKPKKDFLLLYIYKITIYKYILFSSYFLSEILGVFYMCSKISFWAFTLDVSTKNEKQKRFHPHPPRAQKEAHSCYNTYCWLKNIYHLAYIMPIWGARWVMMKFKKMKSYYIDDSKLLLYYIIIIIIIIIIMY